jgi:hypothetical protein
LFERDGNTSIDWESAYGFNKIVPKSGNTKPYEPELFTYPLPDKFPAVPFEPEINWYTLVEPRNTLTGLSRESSVKLISTSRT